MFLNWKREERLDQIQRWGSCSALQIFSGLVSLQAFRPSLNIEGTRKYFHPDLKRIWGVPGLPYFQSTQRILWRVCWEQILLVDGLWDGGRCLFCEQKQLQSLWVASGAGDKVIITYHIICSFVYLALFTPSHLSSIRTVIIITPIAVCARWSESLASGRPLGRQDQINLLQVDSNYTRG